MPTSEWVIGLMSGTSLDGIDAVLVRFGGDDFRLEAQRHAPFPDDLTAELRAITAAPHAVDLDRLGQLDHRLGTLYAEAVDVLLDTCGRRRDTITAIGCHGQTLRHAPRARHGFTLQIGDPNRIAWHTGITTVADFRRRDLAAGGEGAPLVPAFHAERFTAPDQTRVIVNLGGIANLTLLPAGAPEQARGFDTGPGNTLLDLWTRRNLGVAFDAGGRWARSAAPDPALLAVLRDDPYFDRPAPKSTGTDHFTTEWLEQRLAGHGSDPARVQATLLELTAVTIADAVSREAGACAAVFLCGGGARNDRLGERLAELLAPRRIATTAALGLEPEWVEAAAFAWLAWRTLHGLPGNLPAVTGARAPQILGAIYPGSGGAAPLTPSRG